MNTLIKDIFLKYKTNNKYKNSIAVIEENKKYTYNEIFLNALNIASYLYTRLYDFNCKPIYQQNQKYIGIQMEKSANYISTIIACNLLRFAFIPIGTDIPLTRVKDIVKDSNMIFMLNDINISDALKNHYTLIEPNIFEFSENDLAYAIYSSGSTGKPKGIEITHKGIINLVLHQTKIFNVNNNSRFLWILSNNFDGALSDLFVALYNGASIVIPNDIDKTYLYLYNVIEKYMVTHIDMPPSILKCYDYEKIPTCLQTIIVGGEALDIVTAKKFGNKLNLINVYGPTESTICTSACRITDDWDKPYIGLPFDNINYKIINGELYIGGCQLALGYLNNKELTDRKFIIIDGKRYFKTGDAVEFDKEKNNYIFKGRIDRQIKYHGCLIAPEEIEIYYKSFGYNCIVILLNNQLTCFIECENINKDRLISIGQSKFPIWMIPTRFICINKFKLLPSGKIDIFSLSNQIFEKESNTDYTKSEIKIAEIVKDLLKLTKYPDKTVNLKDIGCDSINSIILISRLQSELNILMTPNDLIVNNSIEKIAKFNKATIGYSIKSDKLDKIAYDLISDIKNNNDTDYNNENIFITGSTGFLGSRILHNLILKTKSSTMFYCLIRAKNIEDAYKRLISINDYIIKSNINRIIPIVGDTSKEKFGLDNLTYNILVKQISKVIHIAAEVNVFKTYDQLKDANIVSVKNIIKFCKTGNVKQLHYASTLSVFVSTSKNIGIVYESDYLTDNNIDVYTGYGQTKYLAEKMIFHSNVNAIIHRYGLLTADSHSGKTSKHDFLAMFLKGARKIGYLPYDNTNSLMVDITPVDKAAAKSTDIIINYNKLKIEVFHITSNNPIKLNDLSNIMKDKKYIIDIISYTEWEKIVQKQYKLKNDIDINACKQALCRLNNSKHGFMDLFQTTNIIFDDINTKKYSKISDNIPKTYIEDVIMNFKA